MLQPGGRNTSEQMRWLGHLVRLPPGRLPCEVFPMVGAPGKNPGYAGGTRSLNRPGKA